MILIALIVGYLGSITVLYQSSIKNYQKAEATIVSLQNLKIENLTLKAGLAQVAKETEQIRKVMQEIEIKGEHIESLLPEHSEGNQEVKDLVFLNYKLLDGEGLPPLGGGEGLLRTDGFEVLGQIREELRMFRAEVPLQQDILAELETDVTEHNALLAATPKGWPLDDEGKGYISSAFGFRKDPVTNQQAFHEGLDIGVWYGTSVLATADGEVIYAGWKNGYGRLVIIEHGFGYQTRYAHNSKLVVKTGQKVKRGDLVAYSGNSGKSTGPHLHYEVRVNGVPKNPRDFYKY